MNPKTRGPGSLTLITQKNQSELLLPPEFFLETFFILYIVVKHKLPQAERHRFSISAAHEIERRVHRVPTA
jgi:hypothetical protein